MNQLHCLTTNILNLLLSFLMQLRTTWLSLQKVLPDTFHIVYLKFLLYQLWHFIESVAPVSSNLGMDTYFAGVTLDFPIRKLQWI